MKLNIDAMDRLMWLKGLNGKELARKAGISAPLLSRIRSRGTCNPTTARKLARVLGQEINNRDNNKIDAKTVAQWQDNYEKAVAEIQQAQVTQIREEIATEPDKYERIILDFIDEFIPIDWHRWPMFRRLSFWADKKASNKLMERDKVCAAEVWCEALKSPLQSMTNRDTMRINSIIEKAPDWHKSEKAMRFGPYGVRRGFVKRNKPR